MQAEPGKLGMRVLIERWINRQDMFSLGYAAKPACIHVLVKNEVKRFNIWTMEYEEPTLLKPIKSFTPVHPTFMVNTEDQTEGKSEELGSVGDFAMIDKEEDHQDRKPKPERSCRSWPRIRKSL